MFLFLLAGKAFAQTLPYTLEKPADSNLPDGLITSISDSCYWGMSWNIKVTPTYLNLLDNNATNNNNTDLTYSFSSFPGALLFTPSTIKFRVTVTTGVTSIGSDSDVAFDPESHLVRFTLVDISASYLDPIWSFNLTAGTALPRYEMIALSWSEECFLAGTSTPCTSMTSILQQNITDFIKPDFRTSSKNHAFS